MVVMVWKSTIASITTTNYLLHNNKKKRKKKKKRFKIEFTLTKV